ncbi:MAG: DUF4424 domain-containing protein, partial [Alphaproteobacteria bacterium]|nr:DUF4424 domain-containing protein [Alphaproteobacteria bacterium]
SDAVTMVREDLFISMDEIKVDYIFQNTSETDVESLVAFPMPAIVPSVYEPTGVPVEDTNFLGFRVFVEGEEVFPDLEQRAIATGIDVTGELRDAGLPMVPVTQAASEALEKLPKDLLADWIARGVVMAEYWDVGQGMEMHPYPNWVLEQTYHWRMVFPAGKQVQVSHTYAPSVGGSAGVVFLDWEGKNSELFADYETRYCIDAPFVNAVKRQARTDGGIAMYESWISYILTTGRNWFGPIGTFHLTVDKGATDNLVSFCGTDIEKTGPTRFELTYKDYYPDRELDILILQPTEW